MMCDRIISAGKPAEYTGVGHPRVAGFFMKTYKGMQLMTIYENNMTYRFIHEMVGGFSTAMLIHAIENFGQDENKKKELGEEAFDELYKYDWKATNIRPQTFKMCQDIINEFLENYIADDQKYDIEEMDDPDKINFGFALYMGLFQNPLAMDDEYQQSLKEFPSIDLAPTIELGDDGKAGIAFVKVA